MSWWVLLVVVLFGFGLATAGLRTFDLGGPFRDAFLALAAGRLRNRRPQPDAVERTYWSGREYQKDAARLEQLGYEVTSETHTSPHVASPSLPGRAPIGRRVPTAHVTYQLRKQA